MITGNTIAGIFNTQRVDDPDILIDKLGNIQVCMQPNERTELIVDTCPRSGRLRVTKANNGEIIYKGESVDCVRAVAGHILYGL